MNFRIFSPEKDRLELEKKVRFFAKKNCKELKKKVSFLPKEDRLGLKNKLGFEKIVTIITLKWQTFSLKRTSLAK